MPRRVAGQKLYRKLKAPTRTWSDFPWKKPFASFGDLESHRENVVKLSSLRRVQPAVLREESRASGRDRGTRR